MKLTDLQKEKIDIIFSIITYSAMLCFLIKSFVLLFEFKFFEASIRLIVLTIAYLFSRYVSKKYS